MFASKLSSDNFGMKPYVLAYLKKGPNRNQDSVTAAELQTAHLENIVRAAGDGIASLVWFGGVAVDNTFTQAVGKNGTEMIFGLFAVLFRGVDDFFQKRNLRLDRFVFGPRLVFLQRGLHLLEFSLADGEFVID